MTNNKYLVIKLPGNWIEREQCKQFFKLSVYGTDLEFVGDENIKSIGAEQFIPEEVSLRLNEEIKSQIKKGIAKHIGLQLLQKGMIDFTETQERGMHGTERGLTIKAQITIINEHTLIGADMRGEKDG